MLKLITFIKENPNWEEILQQKPYCLKIKRKNNVILFMYSQNDSNFHNEIVRECRGLILEDKTFKPLCVPFFKFANYGESYADIIDWTTAQVQEKIDGSIIKLWYYNNEWCVSTNGNIDARESIMANSEFNNFYDLFTKACENINFSFDSLDIKNTYIFELTSIFNKIVILYEGISITHIGTRDNNTLEELDIDIGIRKPRKFNLTSLEKCLETAKMLPFNQEGYVVVDKNWKRNKIKSPSYVAAHHFLKGNPDDEKLLDIIKQNNQEEFLTYYPEFSERVNNIKNRFEDFIIEMENISQTLQKFETRKEFAQFATKTKCPPLLFNHYDGKVPSIKAWIYSQDSEKLLKYINK